MRAILLHELPIDAISNGDGELSIYELVGALKSKTFNYDVKGFFYKRDSEIIRDYAKPIWPVLDKLAFPTRLGEKGHPVFKPNNSNPIESAHISTSRGCPFQCTYCDISSFYGRNRRERSIDNVISEIEYLYKERQINNFLFNVY